MNWYPVLFLLGTLKLIVGASTEETSAPPITAADKMHGSQIAVTNLGRFPYQDGEVNLFQNQLKLVDFFFTPFPQVEPNLTECGYNAFSGRTELILFVSLYTTDLLDSVKHHIRNQNGSYHTENYEVSLLPIQSIRLIHNALQTTESKMKYTLNSEWQSNIPILQTVQFIVYTSNISTCETLQNAITSRCRLSDFEVQYSAPVQQTEVRTVEVTTGYVANTSMSKQIQSQLYSEKQELFALTETDYQKLLSETMDQITMNLRTEEGFHSIHASVAIGQLLESELWHMQAQLTEAKDQVWQSLYWTSALTRPDRVSKVLNKLMKQDGMDSDKFRYDCSQADETMKRSLTPHDRQKFDNFAQYLAVQAEVVTNTSGAENHVGYQKSRSFFFTPSGSNGIDTADDVYDQNTEEEENVSDDLIHYKMDMGQFNGTNDEESNVVAIILERKYAEKLVRHFSEHVEIQYDIIKTKPMKIILVKVSLLKSNTKLFSSPVHINTRMHLNILPLRCPYEYRNHSLKENRVIEKCDRLLNIVTNLTTTVDARYNHLLNILNDSQKVADTKHDHLLNIINHLTDIVTKTERSTNASMNTIIATNFSIQTGISHNIKCPPFIDRGLHTSFN